MAQNASTEANRTPTTLRLIAKTAATAKDSAGTRGPDGDKQGLLLLTTQAGLEMIKVGGAVVGFWFLRGTEQLAHNSQILKKLAVAPGRRQRSHLESRAGRCRLARGAGNPKFLLLRRPLAVERRDVLLCE